MHFRENSELLRGKGQSIAGGGRPPCEPYPSLLMLCLLRMVFFNEVRMVQWAIQRNLLATFSEIRALAQFDA